MRYIDGLTMDGTTFDGYYYFDETGRMVTEPGTHELEMTSNGQMFSGTYYFGGANGVLEQKAGTTPDGFPVDETGKVQGLMHLELKIWNRSLRRRYPVMMETGVFTSRIWKQRKSL